ncbi:MAG: hypothetical protein Ct9H300mP19_19930 [Dehalococcoidia bacterium]|nr:MAG: hypothetical protein Ct9H300mP19_19930 [Dehalococcoidia bacterium]
MTELSKFAAKVGNLLVQRGETVSVAESSTGGLISAALLAVPGASLISWVEQWSIRNLLEIHSSKLTRTSCTGCVPQLNHMHFY